MNKPLNISLRWALNVLAHILLFGVVVLIVIGIGAVFFGWKENTTRSDSILFIILSICIGVVPSYFINRKIFKIKRTRLATFILSPLSFCLAFATMLFMTNSFSTEGNKTTVASPKPVIPDRAPYSQTAKADTPFDGATTSSPKEKKAIVASTKPIISNYEGWEYSRCQVSLTLHDQQNEVGRGQSQFTGKEAMGKSRTALFGFSHEIFQVITEFSVFKYVRHCSAR
jgi:hypothetical protein